MSVDFLAVITALVDVVTDMLALLLEPPIIYFLGLAFAGGVLALVRRLVSR